MEEEQFFVLETTNASPPGRKVNGYCINCPDELCAACNVRFEEPLPAEVIVPVREVRKPTYYSEVLRAIEPIFRADLISLWQSSDLTGFCPIPVKLVNERTHYPLKVNAPEYSYMLVKGRARLVKPPIKFICSKCGFVKYDFDNRTGIKVDTATWDNSDFFRPTFYTGLVLCTKRAAKVTLEYGYNKTIAFVRSEEYQTWPPFDVRNWTPEDYDRILEKYLIRVPDLL